MTGQPWDQQMPRGQDSDCLLWGLSCLPPVQVQAALAPSLWRPGPRLLPVKAGQQCLVVGLQPQVQALPWQLLWLQGIQQGEDRLAWPAPCFSHLSEGAQALLQGPTGQPEVSEGAAEPLWQPWGARSWAASPCPSAALWHPQGWGLLMSVAGGRQRRPHVPAACVPWQVVTPWLLQARARTLEGLQLPSMAGELQSSAAAACPCLSAALLARGWALLMQAPVGFLRGWIGGARVWLQLPASPVVGQAECWARQRQSMLELLLWLSSSAAAPPTPHHPRCWKSFALQQSLGYWGA